MTESDYNYFRRRAEEERNAAALADHPHAQHAHLELAGRYEEVAAACDGRVVELTLVRHA